MPTGVPELPPREEWVELAACAETDPELWFPDKGGSPRSAKRICGGCAVRVECLDYAVDNDIRHGVWGGLSGNERKSLRRWERGAA